MATPSTHTRSGKERMVIGVLIVLATALLLGIQSLFLNHIAHALPQDSLWRLVTIGCFLAPPIAFAFLVILKMNYSRSESQDLILYGGMGLELVFFVLNLIVAINSDKIEGTLLGMIGLLLGGAAGVVSAGTTALTLATDPLRAIEKAKIQHDLAIEKQLQAKVGELVDKGLSSERVQVRAEMWAENFIGERLSGVFARRAADTPATPLLPPSQTPPITPEQLAQLAQIDALLKQGGDAPANGGTYPKA